MRNNPLISVVIPRSREAELTADWATDALADTPHELLLARTWVLGAQQATADYICFLEKDCYFDQHYFTRLLSLFERQDAFRKLVLVAPALGVNSYTSRVYGYRMYADGLVPSLEPSSRLPYLAQVAYLPGAIIRRSALGFLLPGKKPLEDSAAACLYLWSHGQRIVLDPDTLYVSTDPSLGEPHIFRDPVSKLKVDRMMDLFTREDIG